MDVTGQILPLTLLIPLLLLTLLVVLLLFAKGAYRKESFFFLLLLNTTIFTADSIQLFSLSEKEPLQLPSGNFLWPTIQYALLLLLFRSFLKKWIRVDWIHYLLVIHLTVIGTLWSVRRINDFSDQNALLEALEVSLLAVMVLVILVRTRYLFIFSSPLFWIASGTLFFYLIFLSVEISIAFKWILLDPRIEKSQLLAAFSIVRSIFYLAASLVYKKNPETPPLN